MFPYTLMIKEEGLNVIILSKGNFFSNKLVAGSTEQSQRCSVQASSKQVTQTFYRVRLSLQQKRVLTSVVMRFLSSLKGWLFWLDNVVLD